MKSKNIGKIIIALVIAVSLSACGKKNTDTPIVPTPTPRLVEIKLENRPYISLTPRSDGHELKLNISKISSDIKSIEYELIYSATDEGLEIEKGLSGTIDIDSDTIERDLLLGTSSCTNGCKYKYDSGVTGGNLNVIFTTQNDQIAMFETAFVLSTTAQIKKEGLTLNDFNIVANPTQTEYFILIQNYNGNYSIFSSATGKGDVTSISPGFTSQDNTKISTEYSHE